MVFSVLTISALFHFAKGMPLGEIVRFRRKKKTLSPIAIEGGWLSTGYTVMLRSYTGKDS